MLTHVVTKINDCNSATEMSKSVDLLQAISWIAQTWEKVSESTIKKYFIKAGFPSEDESPVSFTEEHQEFDPFQELEDSELVRVNSRCKLRIWHRLWIGVKFEVISVKELLGLKWVGNTSRQLTPQKRAPAW